jgi:hypothetical protein
MKRTFMRRSSLVALFLICFSIIGVAVYAVCQGGVSQWQEQSNNVIGTCFGHTINYSYGWNISWVDGGSTASKKVISNGTCNNVSAPTDSCVPKYVLSYTITPRLGGIDTTATISSYNGLEVGATCDFSAGVADSDTHTKFCDNPKGACNGTPDYSTYPSGCATGFTLSGGVCTRSSAFISRCYTYGDGYDDTNCVCEGCASCGGSPIFVDLGGNGVKFTDAARGVHFDLNSRDDAEQISWFAPGEKAAWLALDRNGNGEIENGRELFGDFTAQPESPTRNGFSALAEFDRVASGGNGDGQIDARDAVYASLLLWDDNNHDGVSQPNELTRIADSPVKTISLDYRSARKRDQYGNELRYRAKVTAQGGAKLGPYAYDVFLLGQ